MKLSRWKMDKYTYFSPRIMINIVNLESKGNFFPVVSIPRKKSHLIIKNYKSPNYLVASEVSPKEKLSGFLYEAPEINLALES